MEVTKCEKFQIPMYKGFKAGISDKLYSLWLPNCSTGPFKCQKILYSKVDPIGLCKIAWFPWQPIIHFREWGCTFKNTRIATTTHPRILKFVPKQLLDIALLFDGQICKLSHFHIHEYK